MSWQPFFSAFFKHLTYLVLVLFIFPAILIQGCARLHPAEAPIQQLASDELPSTQLPSVPDGGASGQATCAAADESGLVQEGWDVATLSTTPASEGRQDRKAEPLTASEADLVSGLPPNAELKPDEPRSAGRKTAGREGGPVATDEEESASRAVKPAGREEPTYDIPVDINPQVQSYIDTFAGRHRARFGRYLCRSTRYVPMMGEILQEHGLPQDLVYMVLVESGFSTHAYSRARAVGPWQFIKSTARLYGLRVDWWVDERRDPVKSTHAACLYLKNLYQRFGSWELAMAAYNGGELRVDLAIRRAETRDFWELAKTPYLKAETKNYVPQVIAAAIVAKNRERYDFINLAYAEPFACDQVELYDAVDLKLIAKLAGTGYQTIRALNPELLRTATPPRQYLVRIPAGTRSGFLKRFAEVSSEKLVTWRKYKVRRGDTLSFIAERFGTSVEAIMKVNKLRSASRIVAGRSLVVPVWTGEVGSDAEMAALVRPKEPSGRDAERLLTHVISKGESLGNIAKSYNTSLRAIMDANGLKSAHRIYAGKTLLIPVSEGVASPVKKLRGPIRSSRRASPSGRATPAFHVVQPGENLWGIAEFYGTTLAALQRLNNIANPSLIRVGERLRISSSEVSTRGEGRASRAESQEADVVHIVKKGDTLWQIAKTYGVDVRALQSWNGLTDKTIIRPGDQLKIIAAR